MSYSATFPHLRRRTPWMLGASFFLLIGCTGGPTGPVPAPEEFGVLFIGNSLTFVNDLPGMLRELFEMGGADPIVIGEETSPNFGLEDHWHRGARDRIQGAPWDFVVMQQGPSATEGRPSLLQFSKLFADDIRAVGGTPALYMVWPARVRAFDFPGVSDSYQVAAETIDGSLFPAGEAWLAAWRMDPTVDLYGPDQFHPSATGTYLAALVMYQQLSGNDPRTLPPRIPGFGTISQELADLLQSAAAEANENFAR